jgi:hypothetical protein
MHFSWNAHVFINYIYIRVHDVQSRVSQLFQQICNNLFTFYRFKFF